MANSSSANKKGWAIREATTDDAEALQDCMVAAYSIYQPRMGEQPLPPLETDYKEEIQNYPAWVAESEPLKSVVGGLIMLFELDHAVLANVAVSPDFQGHGLGRGLIDFAQEQARARGYSSLRLATHSLLTENIAMYEHLGWKRVGEEGNRVYFEKPLG